MVKFNPAKLTITYKGVTDDGPICPRHYTLTRSETQDDLFLTIDSNPLLAEVSAAWDDSGGTYSLIVRARVDSIHDRKTEVQQRYDDLNRQLPLVLESIRYGDSKFFNNHAELDYAPILVHFLSVYPEFGAVKYFGQPLDYLFIH